jgi:hypothetical protein
MDEKDEKMFFAGMALVGLAMKGIAPIAAARWAWDYADHMYEQKPREEKE